MTKIIVAGGRDFKDYQLLKEKLDYYLSNQGDIEIVSGKQVTRDKATGEKFGADYFGELYAKEMGYPVKEFPADWNLGKKGGILRNREMCDYADCLIAFWDYSSRGTKNVIEEATKRNLKVRIVRYF